MGGCARGFGRHPRAPSAAALLKGHAHFERDDVEHGSGALVSERKTLCRRAPVAILEAHDVVFTEIIAALHLDDHERIGAAIFEAMASFDRDIRRLVRMNIECVLAVDDVRDSTNDDPVLAAPMMEL
jgi:hypothetical protein